MRLTFYRQLQVTVGYFFIYALCTYVSLMTGVGLTGNPAFQSCSIFAFRKNLYFLQANGRMNITVTYRRKVQYKSVEITNKIQRCNRIHYSKVYWRLSMFREAQRSSLGALNCVCSLWFIYLSLQVLLNQVAAFVLLFQSLLKAQRVSSGTPLIIRSSKLCLQPLVYIFITTSLVKPGGCVRFVQFPFGVLISVFYMWQMLWEVSHPHLSRLFSKMWLSSFYIIEDN